MKYDYEEQFTDALKKINDNNLKKKLVAIKKLVCERMKLENDFKKEHNKLEAKYEKLYQPIYEKRKNIIKKKIIKIIYYLTLILLIPYHLQKK